MNDKQTYSENISHNCFYIRSVSANVDKTKHMVMPRDQNARRSQSMRFDKSSL